MAARVRGRGESADWWRYVAFFIAVTTSHGLPDTLTYGQLGVAFFSPFDPARYFLPWRPLVVPYIGGLDTILSP